MNANAHTHSHAHLNRQGLPYFESLNVNIDIYGRRDICFTKGLATRLL